MIDDNSTTLKLVEIKLKANGAIKEDDVFFKYTNAVSFFRDYDAGKYFDLIIVDHDLGIGVTWGYEIIMILNSSGYTRKSVLFTSDETAELKSNVSHVNAEYVSKRSSGDYDPYERLAGLIEEVRLNNKDVK